MFKVQGDRFTGIVCGPCDDPAAVFRIDDGRILDAERLTFSINHINHIDTPPSTQRTGLSRNIMRGTLTGNVMKFKWVREGAENEPGGEMVLIGSIR